jgi:hypothetical protein
MLTRKSVGRLAATLAGMVGPSSGGGVLVMGGVDIADGALGEGVVVDVEPPPQAAIRKAIAVARPRSVRALGRYRSNAGLFLDCAFVSNVRLLLHHRTGWPWDGRDLLPYTTI